MYYSFLYQGIFGIAFLNFLVFWTDLFFFTTNKPYLFTSYPLSKNSSGFEKPRKTQQISTYPDTDQRLEFQE